MMAYKAYLIVGDKKLRVFPNNKKTSLFETIELATKTLEAKTRRLKINSTGQIFDTENNLAFTIAL